MPIVYRVDHEVRIVLAAGHGVMTDADVFGYQREVWSRPEVRGYDELIDMTRVVEIAVPSGDRVKDLAALSAEMDDKATRSRFAIVAPADVAYGLGRMFQALRELNRKSTKEVAVFRTMDEALAFLEIDSAVSMPDPP
jgi:hypothetical protein